MKNTQRSQQFITHEIFIKLNSREWKKDLGIKRLNYLNKIAFPVIFFNFLKLKFSFFIQINKKISNYQYLKFFLMLKL